MGNSLDMNSLRCPAKSQNSNSLSHRDRELALNLGVVVVGLRQT